MGLPQRLLTGPIDESTAESKATPKEPCANVPAPDAKSESMDIDDSTEHPDLPSSAEQVETTQNTSTVSDAPIVSSPNDSTQAADLSKLEIKTTQEATNVSSAPADVTMAEAPSTPTKVPREREEDDAEEPVAKRAKTADSGETMADSVLVAMNSIVDTPAQETGSAGLDSAIPDHLPITPYQNKKTREVLANVKKTKTGGNFRKPVQELWPGLWNDYKAKIENPIDISAIEVKLREDKYANYVRMPEIIHTKAPVKPEKGKAQPTRHTEPRAATQPRRASHSQPPPPPPATTTKPKVEASPSSASASTTAQAFAIPPSGIPQIRRDSTRDDHDRPKRPIHPPKNRDPEYASKANRKKKLDPEQRFFEVVLDEVKKVKYFAMNQWFLAPVDPVALNIPNYFKIIKKPMDLATMSEKNYDGEYKTVKDIEKDMKLIVHNSEIFNGPDHDVSSQARQLEELFKSQLAGKDKWMERHVPSATSAAHASGASPQRSIGESDDESEGEGDEEDSDAIQSLQQRLNEEQEKLNRLLNSKKPDLTMMEVQQSMVGMLQRKLVEERTKFHSEKKPKKKKAASSKSKSKAGGGGPVSGNKKSSGPAHTKKQAGGSKKTALPKKRPIGALEKAVIAEGINELDGNTLTKAVEIIKRDTGQNENDDGEMELDIDSLTLDALTKLYDLINKAHPHIRQSLAKKPEYSNALNSEPEPKAKKNKPMNKHEQERKIEQLRELKAQLQRHGSGSQEPPPGEVEAPAAADSSESSDSEEE
ncbi:Bromodomain-containing protein [Xylaria intraflava]|nr:Bromodomain-containing protein [Xylaria intraflava]